MVGRPDQRADPRIELRFVTPSAVGAARLAIVAGDDGLDPDGYAELLGLAIPARMAVDVRAHYRFVLTMLGDAATRDWVTQRWDAPRRMFTWEGSDNVTAVCWVTDCRRQQSGSWLCVACSKAHVDAVGVDPVAVGAVELRRWARGQEPAAAPELCAVVGSGELRCGRPPASEGLCISHYNRWLRGALRRGEEFGPWLAAQWPFPPSHACVVQSCRRLALTGTSRTLAQRCCKQHAVRWRNAVRAGLVTPKEFQRWTEAESPVDASWLDVWLKDANDVVVAEVLWSIAADRDGHRVHPSTVTGLISEAIGGGARRLSEIEAVTGGSRRLLRRWLGRLDVLTADPDDEWHRDKVRLDVVRPEAHRALTLDFARISQPWLERLTREVVQARTYTVGPTRLVEYVAAATRLSAALATRRDSGNDPPRLDQRAARSLVRQLSEEPRRHEESVRQDIYGLKFLIEEGRRLGAVESLPGSFRFDPAWLPPKTTVRKGADEVAFPDATFAFLLGMDHVLGPAVLELLRSVPRIGFAGDVAVETVRIAANFGRRPGEAYKLTVNRIRSDDGGGAAVRYHDFKNRVDGLWLPIDRRSANHVLDWVDRLRERFPDTPASELALLPAPQKNPRGTVPIAASAMSEWFRAWVTLAEQAIVVAKLHHAVQVPIKLLLGLRWEDCSNQRLQIERRSIRVNAAAWRMLVDYRAGLHPVRRRRAEDQWVFTSPFDLMQEPTSITRFDALGPDWWDTVLAYESSGIPGAHLGRETISSWDLQVRRFRHTYLQHLIDAGTDPLVVQELAGHATIDTTIGYYVRPRDEALREAVDQLSAYRRNRFGKLVSALTILPSATDVVTNTCTNPQVHRFDKEGCDHGGLCYSCPHFAADFSNRADINVQLQTLRRHAERLEAIDPAARSPIDEARLLTLRDDIEGWSRIRLSLDQSLERLPSTERDKVIAACKIVRSARNALRYGIRSGTGQILLEEPEP